VGVVTGEGRSPRRVLSIALLGLLALLPLGFEQYKLYVASLTLVYLVMAIGLNLTLGYAGQISLAHGAFMAFGSYAVAILGPRGLPFELGLGLGAALAFGSGLLLGFPALKVKHHFLAMVTLGFNIIVFLALRNWESLTGGSFGISGIPRPAWGPLRSHSGPIAPTTPTCSAGRSWWSARPTGS
jgi:branched-chain amino acid transport system permease protein